MRNFSLAGGNAASVSVVLTEELSKDPHLVRSSSSFAIHRWISFLSRPPLVFQTKPETETSVAPKKNPPVFIVFFILMVAA